MKVSSIIKGKRVNLHKHNLQKTFNIPLGEKKMHTFFDKALLPLKSLDEANLYEPVMDLSNKLYEKGYSGLDLMNYIDPIYKNDFKKEDYQYDSEIILGNEIQIGRFLLMSSTNSIILEDNVLLSERIFMGDNNHTFSHLHVPIMQQPNKKGNPIFIGKVSWLGIGATILAGTHLGRNCVVGANSVVADMFESNSVIGMEKAKLLFKK